MLKTMQDAHMSRRAGDLRWLVRIVDKRTEVLRQKQRAAPAGAPERQAFPAVATALPQKLKDSQMWLLPFSVSLTFTKTRTSWLRSKSRKLRKET